VDLAGTGREFQNPIPRTTTEPNMFLVDWLGELIRNVFSGQENTKKIIQITIQFTIVNMK
jgi:hypothetical protein